MPHAVPLSTLYARFPFFTFYQKYHTTCICGWRRRAWAQARAVSCRGMDVSVWRAISGDVKQDNVRYSVLLFMGSMELSGTFTHTACDPMYNSRAVGCFIEYPCSARCRWMVTPSPRGAMSATTPRRAFHQTPSRRPSGDRNESGISPEHCVDRAEVAQLSAQLGF